MTLHPLQAEHTDWLRSRIDRDPARHAFLHSLLRITGTARVSSSVGTLYGYFESGRPVAAYWLGSSIMAVDPTPASNEAAARWLNTRGRFSCSLIGDAPAILDLHARLRWGAPRGVRASQPLLVADRAPAVAPDPRVRLGTPADLPAAFAASVEMFTEEVGFSPVERGASGYRSRVQSLLQTDSTLLFTSTTGPFGDTIRPWPAPEAPSQVVFKADLGIRSEAAVQIQGVWVHPDFRGRGISAPAMVAVTDWVKENVSPVVSLYVNDYNDRARRTYDRAGYSQIGTFATVMY
ncbi:GNAT family N-acetyltransferase [Brevibacterium litoralis]|uniref:GNAT family N-acetyltransferase n=1 Tax=Brevibacterium litoralis TaxID=3138935 RepID=UPI0032EFA759